MRDLLRQKIQEAVAAPPPRLTRRDVRLPRVAGKAHAVIGVRRCGKTSFLWQCLAERQASGAPREALLLLGLEDDRLAGLQVEDLAWLVEEHSRLFPALKDCAVVTYFFDEIQLVPGWERFARRLADTEGVELFLSGSSARMLSREVATSMRGRALEVLIHPFSFREYLRHLGAEPATPWPRLARTARAGIEHRLGVYLREGGFPEAVGAGDRDRDSLLRSYVDVVVLRDVIERHAVSNPVALRWLQRHLLANPAGLFSVQKLHNDLRSQGLPVAKDTLHQYLAHLEDAFLVRTVSLHSASERQRMVNPRKAYPVDPGLIPLFDRAGRANLGHALETAIYLELERRGYRTEYVKTADGGEVDFLAASPGAETLLIQVCADLHEAATREREVAALLAAVREHPRAEPLLLTLDPTPPRPELPAPLRWQPASAWLLGEE